MQHVSVFDPQRCPPGISGCRHGKLHPCRRLRLPQLTTQRCWRKIRFRPPEKHTKLMQDTS